jgi:hypothetical protein
MREEHDTGSTGGPGITMADVIALLDACAGARVHVAIDSSIYGGWFQPLSISGTLFRAPPVGEQIEWGGLEADYLVGEARIYVTSVDVFSPRIQVPVEEGDCAHLILELAPEPPEGSLEVPASLVIGLPADHPAVSELLAPTT